MSEIVVGYDGSQGTEQALQWAAEEADRRGVCLHLLCTWQLPVAPGPFALSLDARLRDAARSTLKAARRRTRQRHPRVEVITTVVPGPPAPALIDASRKADLLVIGRRGHGTFTGLLLGSVSLHCTTHAACPVVVVRSAGANAGVSSHSGRAS